MFKVKVFKPRYLEDSETLQQIGEDLGQCFNDIEQEYGIKLVFGHRRKAELVFHAEVPQGPS